MLNAAASAPPKVYVSVSPASGSVAPTALPMSCPEPVFSAIERVAVLLAKLGASLTSVTLIVTGMLSLPPLPSETSTFTE